MNFMKNLKLHSDNTDLYDVVCDPENMKSDSEYDPDQLQYLMGLFLGYSLGAHRIHQNLSSPTNKQTNPAIQR